MKNRIKRTLAFLLTALMTFTTMFGNVSANAFAEEQTNVQTIAAFDVAADATLPASITSGVSGNTELDVSGATKNGYSGNAYEKSDMQGTSQINNIVISGTYADTETNVVTEKCALVTSSSTVRYGEKFSDTVKLECETSDARIYYSFNKETGYTAYTEPFAVNSEKTVYAYAQKEGCSDSDIAEIKIAQTKCKQPNADVKSKAEVEAGQIITANSKTEGATILYRLNKKGDFTECDGTVVIPDVEGALNIQFRARCEGYAESDTAGFNYTVKKKEVIPPTPVSVTLSEVKDGDSFYIVANDSKQVLTSVVSDKKLSGVAGEIDESGKFTVKKTKANETLVDSIVKLTAKADEEGFYTFTAKDKEGNDVYLTCPATGNGLSFEKEKNDYSVWKVDVSENDVLIGNKSASYTKNDTAYEEYVEFYNGFTAYNFLPGSTAKKAYLLSLYTDVTITEASTGDDGDDTKTNCLSELKDGDVVLMYINGFVLSQEADGAKIKGIQASLDNGSLSAPDKAAYLKVVVNPEDNTIAFKEAVSGKFLATSETGSSLSYFDNITGLSSWTLEKQENGFYVQNKEAKYNGTTSQYIEYYKDFTTFSLKSGGAAYLTNFYKVKLPVLADESVTQTVAQWAGNANYEENNITKDIPGDMFSTNDLKDTASTYSAVVSGEKVDAYTKASSSTTGSTSYYLGAKGVGSGTDDYLQFELSSLGYANLKMSFRLRVSNTAAGDFTLKYSTDGVKFENFTTGSYSYAYTAYSTEGSSSNVSKEGNITDGIAKPGMAPTNYVSFEFNVPKEASNEERIYIRLCPGSTKAKGDGAPTTGGVVRIDSVVITANPVIDESVCSYVKATPDSGTVAVGETISLSTATENARIYYSLNEGEYTEYNAGVKLDSLPATLVAYAVKDGLKNSSRTVYLYTQAQCEAVKAAPNGGAVAKGTKVTLRDNTEGARILYRLSDTEVWTEYTEPFTISEFPCTYYVKASKDGYADSAQSTLTFTERTNEKYNIYFGQIHSHTNISDGAGTLEDAFKHAKSVKNLDYIVVTDHSNSFDEADNGDITKNNDSAETNEWTYAHKLAENMSDSEFTCMYGYEMTWSNGLGHMNTYNTPGFQSRTQKDYSTYSTALENYYKALEKVPDSISMFNHPGTTFGDFQDFAYFTEERDALINLIEVGNGEGAIGSSGYFPSYEYFTRALDKGWHVAPSNNQDNHKGLWGDANTGRTVALCDTNSETDFYDAMRNRRVYATEDNDLSIYYTLNGYIMGSVLDEDIAGDEVKLSVDLSDPTDAKIGKVSVIVNGGLEIESRVIDKNADTVEFNLPNRYSYYYIKIVEDDGDIAVTAPVWTGDVEACGINSVTSDTAIAVAGDPYDVDLQLYNNEKEPLVIESIEYTLTKVNGEVTSLKKLTAKDLGEEAEVKPNKTVSLPFEYIYYGVGRVAYGVIVNATLNGVSKVYNGTISTEYKDPAMVGEIVIDGTHANDYVAGYYAGNMNNFIKLAAENDLRARVVEDRITKETLNNCELLVISAPAAKSGTANGKNYNKSSFEAEFIETVKDYMNAGGSVIICGIADYNNYQAAAELNKLLKEIGSTIRVNSDEVMDDENNGGQTYRLYPENFDDSSVYINGVVSKKMSNNYQKYSQYSGCSIDVSNAVENEFVSAATVLVKGFDTTYSVNCKDEDGKSAGNTPNDNKGNVTFLAQQYTKKGGDIFVAGGVFISDFEIKYEVDNNDDLPYVNHTIAKNILLSKKLVLPATAIADVRKADMGDIFAVEGYVTSGTANANNTFFDSIYIQDETGGIDIFPYSEVGLEIGTKIRILGYLDAYQGDLELQVIQGEIFPEDERKVFEPIVLSTKDAMDYNQYGGSLVKTTGEVTRVNVENGVLSEFWLKDSSGEEAAIFIDGYITSAVTGKNELADFVKEGATVSAVGVLYKHPEGDATESVPVFRVRNCDEITLVKANEGNKPSEPSGRTDSSNSESKGTDTKASEEARAVLPGQEIPVIGRTNPVRGNNRLSRNEAGVESAEETAVTKLEGAEISDEETPKTAGLDGVLVELSDAGKKALEEELKKLVEAIASGNEIGNTVSKATAEAISKAYADGKKLEIETGVKLVSRDAIDKEVIKAIEEAAASNSTGLGMEMASYFDISLFITADGEKIGEILELGKPVELSVSIPKDIDTADNEFFAVRYHDGEASVLEGSLDEEGRRFVFTTDKFSIYALAYKTVGGEPVPLTAEISDHKSTVGIILIVLGGMAALAVAFWLVKNGRVKKEEN